MNLLTALVNRLDLIPEDAIPDTCGACGTPLANCDVNCMDAANMSEHNGVIRNAHALIEDIKNQLVRSDKMYVLIEPDNTIHGVFDSANAPLAASLAKKMNEAIFGEDNDWVRLSEHVINDHMKAVEALAGYESKSST